MILIDTQKLLDCDKQLVLGGSSVDFVPGTFFMVSPTVITSFCMRALRQPASRGSLIAHLNKLTCMYVRDRVGLL